MCGAAAPSQDGRVGPRRAAGRRAPRRREIARPHGSLYPEVHGSTIRNSREAGTSGTRVKRRVGERRAGAKGDGAQRGSERRADAAPPGMNLENVPTERRASLTATRLHPCGRSGAGGPRRQTRISGDLGVGGWAQAGSDG